MEGYSNYIHPELVKYSLEEQVVGTFVNEKPLYQRTFIGTFINKGLNNKMYLFEYVLSVVDWNIDTFVYGTGSCKFNTPSNGYVYYISTEDINLSTTLTVLRVCRVEYISSTNEIYVVVRTGSNDHKYTDCYITVWYTKTTD